MPGDRMEGEEARPAECLNTSSSLVTPPTEVCRMPEERPTPEPEGPAPPAKGEKPEKPTKKKEEEKEEPKAPRAPKKLEGVKEDFRYIVRRPTTASQARRPWRS